jgi:imidazolonepropionase-like amidohydrolase
MHLRGTVLPDGVERDLFVLDGRFTFTEQPEAETVADGGFLVPGLVDAHAHLALASPAGDDASEHDRIRASARAQLDAGVLLLREPGGPSRASTGLGPDDGLPRVLSAGRMLAAPGLYVPGLGREVEPDELVAAAEEEAELSGGWIKIIADWFGADGKIRTGFPAATVTEVVDRAHAAGRRVAMHAMSVGGMDLAIEAGVDSIEHGEGITDDHIAVMAERGTAFVPTLTILPGIAGLIAHLPESIADVARHAEMVGRAAEAGVLILAGTDAGMVPHGIVAQEVRNLVAAGLAATDALAAGSWAAREYLGLPGIAEGAPADAVVFRTDPREDPAALDHPEARILDGRLVTA